MGNYALSGKTALVIGSGGHLMSPIALKIASEGVFVYVADLRLSDAQKTSNLINASGFNSSPLEIDVSSDESLLQAKKHIELQNHYVDFLLNGAGINAPTPFFEIDRREWHKILEIQLIGVAMACSIFGKSMVERRFGSIVNISSASANPPLSKAFAYSAAKSAVLNFTKNLAREFGDTGVRVNAIRPGFFPTKWNLENFIDEKRKNDILGHTPMKRFGSPEELTGAVLWLLSDQASFVTGSEIAIDGGFSAMSI